MANKLYQVIVSNIGTVSTSNSRSMALESFKEYSEQSQNGYGRASGEEVTLLVDGIETKHYAPKKKLPLIKDIRALLVALKANIGDDYRTEGQEDETPTMQVTIGANDAGEWSYQTGDNSYSGGAYSFPHWGICYLQRRSNCTELARDIVDQIAELMYQ